MTILDAFRDNVDRLGEGPCLHHKAAGRWQSLSWRECARLIGNVANALSNMGVRAGDSVGILSSTRYEWTIADMAILSIGAVTVPIYPTISAEQTTAMIKDSEIKAFFIENDGLLEKLAGLGTPPSKIIFFDARKGYYSFDEMSLSGEGKALFAVPRLCGADTASIIYTSGTTGEPKGAVITHANIMAEVDALRKHFPMDENAVMLTILPLAHVLARAVQFFQLASGCQAAYAEKVEKVGENLKEVRPHMTVVVPRFIEKVYEKVTEKIMSAGNLKRALFNWAMLIGAEAAAKKKKEEPLSPVLKLKYSAAVWLVLGKIRRAFGGRIRFIVSGGAPLQPELARFFHGVGLLILEGYGLTETFAAVTVNRQNDYHLGTVGKPIDGVEIKLSPDGEILVKGGMVFKGYHNRPEETMSAFAGEGWLKTGDIGEFSKDGFLRITDRKKDIMVTSTGKNIAPQAIEALLTESEFISHAVVFGDRKKYVAAVLSLNEDAVRRFAAQSGVSRPDWPSIRESVEVKKKIEEVVAGVNKRLAGFETVKKFAILDRDFTIETGELTPTMKVKRRIVEERYREIVEGLYKD